MGQTVTEKIAQAHLTEGPKRPLRAGDFVSLRPKRLMTHDNTSAVMQKFRAMGATRLFDPGQLVFPLDHDIQNQAEENQKKYRNIEAFAREHGVDFYPAGTGIGHQILCERGYVTPGSLIVASDSHANMHGALGAVGTPVVRTDAAAIWATGEFWWQIPRSVEVELTGELPPGITGKDVILALCGLYPDEALNAALEFSGPGLPSLSIDARLTIANMSTEWGALVCWFPVDATAIAWLRETRNQRIRRGEPERYSETDVANWASSPPAPDADAEYAARITLDLGELACYVAGPDSVQAVRPLAELAARRVPIQKAYLLSCVNSRLQDLEAAAVAFRERKVARSVRFYLAAASRWVQEEAERRGIWQRLLDAGAIVLPPGCGPCIGLGAGLLEPGETGISATNRNFKGRMGSREAQCYLASPAVVASSAVAGYICSPDGMAARSGTLPARHYAELSAQTVPAEHVEILPGFPRQIRGRLVFLPQDNLSTDAIYPGRYTYRDDVTPERMAQVVLENYDPQFSARSHPGDVIVAGANFGCGSSREQAATAVKAKGMALVVAASFSQTYLRNAFNNGVLCVEQPNLVQRLRTSFAGQVATGEKTLIPGDEVVIDFPSGVITYRGDEFRFPPLGGVPQSLVAAGGVEKLVAQKLRHQLTIVD